MHLYDTCKFFNNYFFLTPHKNKNCPIYGKSLLLFYVNAVIATIMVRPLYVIATNYRLISHKRLKTLRVKQDLNKRISSIQYNLLNLPQNITYSTGSTITYKYDAAGKKLHVAYGSPSSTTDYCGNMIYENGALKQILIDDGYVTFSGTPQVSVSVNYNRFIRFLSNRL